MTNAPDPGFAIYIHWPFCQSKCPYCDFNSHVAASIDQTRWLKAYLQEIDRAAAETAGRTVRSVFFGGGTPSLMKAEVVADIVARIRSGWRMSNDPEITLEANPSSVEASRFAAYAAAGINRVSVGVQAFNDDDLRKLGRLHSVKEAMQALEIARSTFDRVSFDVIYGRQGQDPDAWRQELLQALAIKPTHLSLYQLTIEEGTVFQERFQRGQLRGLPDEDRSAELFEITQELCASVGLPAYEVSNHAKAGEESRHNLIYWQGGDYVGIGPGAHGRLTLGSARYATETVRGPAQWLDAVEITGKGEIERMALSGKDAAVEYLLMGLRLYDGIWLDRLYRHAPDVLDVMAAVSLEGQGLVQKTEDRLRVTESGMPVLNYILRKLIRN